MDTNEVQLVCAQIAGVTYVDGSLAITPGEPYVVPPTIHRDGATWTIVLEADRKGSPEVARSFVAVTGGPGRQIAETLRDVEPEEMNFHFALDVGFAIGGHIVPARLYVGQGHYAFTNNWWLGATALQRTGDNTAVLEVADAAARARFDVVAATSTMTLTLG